MRTPRFISKSAAAACAAGLFLCATTALAWSGPTAGQLPPGQAGNAAAPVHTGSTAQGKTGALTVTGFLANYVSVGATINNNAVTAPQFCIGTNCISSWTAAGSSQWTTAASNIYYSTGNVGVGDASPGNKLTVGTAGSAENAAYDIGAGTMAVNSSLYSYGYLCAGNVSGACTGNGGVVIGPSLTGITTSGIGLNTGSGHSFIHNGGNFGIGTFAPAQKLDVAGNIRMTGTTLYTNGASSGYGSLTIDGSKNGWWGINFKNSGTNVKTLMIHQSHQGIFSTADDAWEWRFTNGALDIGTVPFTLVTGTVPANRVAAGAFTASQLTSPHVGLNSGITASHYIWGYQEPGAWTYPYPDLVLGYHTGLKIGANYSYGGTKFYNEHPGLASTEIFSVGNGDNNVRAAYNLSAGGTITGTGGVYSGGNMYTNANYGYGLVGLYSSVRYQGVFSMGAGYQLAPDGTGPGNLYGIAWSYDGMPQSKAGLWHQALFMMNGITYTAIGNGIWTNSNVTAAGFFYNSDIRYKKNIEALSGSLNKVLNLRGVTYEWKDSSKGQGVQLGFVAQEVEKIAPELVSTDKDGYKSVDYARVTPLLVEAMQEQQAQLESQQQRIDALETKVEALIQP